MNYENLTLGEIVAQDVRAASILKQVNIDFCCGGKKTLLQACTEKSIQPKDIIKDLENLEHEPQNNSQNYNEWELGFLADYIVNTHHKYVLKTLPELIFYTQKIAQVHGTHHPELIEVAELFGKLNTELLQHLAKEEEDLFPAIKDALANRSVNSMQLIEKEISRMEGEHEFAGGTMDYIHQLTNGYQLPGDACNTFTLTYKLLEQFEDDLHYHVHLENNILYPKALNIK